MNIMIIYASNSGGTQMATQAVNDKLAAGGHTVTMKLVSEATPDDLGGADLTILASPSWDYEDKTGMPLEDFIHFMEKAKAKVCEGKKFAVFGLGDSTYTHFCGAVDHLVEFVKMMKGTLVADPIRIDNYFGNMAGYNEQLTSWADKLVTA